jgi:cell wall-associated NlpC family hydrolase
MNFNKYTSIPFKAHGRDRDGVDCWGLVWMIYKNELNIKLPRYDKEYSDPDDYREVAALVAGEKSTWVEVPKGEERPGDVLLLKLLGVPCHVATVMENGYMIHIMNRINAVSERYDVTRWAKRVEGIFRYAG